MARKQTNSELLREILSRHFIELSDEQLESVEAPTKYSDIFYVRLFGRLGEKPGVTVIFNILVEYAQARDKRNGKISLTRRVWKPYLLIDAQRIYLLQDQIEHKQRG